MKTIQVLLPVNNLNIVTMFDLVPFQTSDYCFKLSYADTLLKELVTEADVTAVIPAVVAIINQAKQNGVAAIIHYAFGDIGFSKKNEMDLIPIISLGRLSIRLACKISKTFFTVIPIQMEHQPFIQNLIAEENLTNQYRATTNSIKMTPDDIRKSPDETLNCLLNIANIEIKENNIDTFSFGCGSFIGFEKPLQTKLRGLHGEQINVVGIFDGVSQFAKMLLKDLLNVGV